MLVIATYIEQVFIKLAGHQSSHIKLYDHNTSHDQMWTLG